MFGSKYLRLCRYHFFIVVIVGILFNSCNQKPTKVVERDTTITEKISFNNLFFDSSSLNNFLELNTTLAEFKEQFYNFYKLRNYEFAWFDSKGISEQAHNFYNLLHTTYLENGDSTLLNSDVLSNYKGFKKSNYNFYTKKELLNTELKLTGQFFNYASKVYKGIELDAIGLGWFIPTKKINISALLDTVLRNKANNPEVYVPFNSQYKKLQQQLLHFYKIQKIYPVDTLEYSQKYPSLGDSSDVISKIKLRLFLLQDLGKNDNSNFFDANLQNAIAHFQERMGLNKTTSLNNSFIKELNKPIEKRIMQILINLERARWLPAEKDSNYILVNIPEFKLHVFDSAINVWDMNVIVGKQATTTVIFNGNLKYIVFSPYWYIPSNITKNEILPSIAKDKNYLSKNNIEQYGKAGNVPMFRQKPGPQNALGRVKFLFPNSYEIYFHDTPNKSYFSSNNRSLSNGCIRLGEPQKLATYLLRNEKLYSDSTIKKLMNLETEKWVSLPKSIPVFIVYFTTWVDKSGVLNFRNDIYGHDEKMKVKMFVSDTTTAKINKF